MARGKQSNPRQQATVSDLIVIIICPSGLICIAFTDTSSVQFSCECAIFYLQVGPAAAVDDSSGSSSGSGGFLPPPAAAGPAAGPGRDASTPNNSNQPEVEDEGRQDHNEAGDDGN